jgi:MtN3 and saliva related transmembrane protein
MWLSRSSEEQQIRPATVLTACFKTKDAAGGKKTMLKLTFLGLAAALCMTASFMPQVMKTWKTRSTADISLGMYLVLVFGTVLWLAYGVFLEDTSLMVGNGITLVLAGRILLFKLRYG